jgi:DNA end-binding protein Ku
MHQREHIVIIRPRANGLTLHTMFYESEIRALAEYGKDHPELKDAEKKLAVQLIENLAAEFEPAKYRDEYQEGMRALIAAKQEGKGIAAVSHPSRAPVVDLMAALQKSLEKKPVAPAKKPPVRAISIVKEEPKSGKKPAKKVAS